MEKITKIVNGNTYDFINEYWSTYNAWGHKTHLFKNNYEIATNRVRYYNRTWESYKYQSCMYGCVYQLIEERTKDLTYHFKEENNIKKLTKKWELEYNDYLNCDSELKELNKLMEEIK